MSPDGELHARLYSSLYRIRHVEEATTYLLRRGMIRGPVPLSIGQGAVAVGACDALRPDDVVFASHRSHALYLAKGGDLKTMMAELWGKASGSTKGSGWSVHLIDLVAEVAGGTSIVASTIPNAVGYAYAQKLRRTGRVVVSFFGDGAIEESALHESLNLASLKRLPIVFICENNLYAGQSNYAARRRADACALARTYGMAAERIGDNDVFEIREAVGSAVRELREGAEGPRFWDLGYRSPEEVRPWIEDDQVKKLACLVPTRTRLDIEASIEREIGEAMSFAEAAPIPGPERLVVDLCTEPL